MSKSTYKNAIEAKLKALGFEKVPLAYPTKPGTPAGITFVNTTNPDNKKRFSSWDEADRAVKIEKDKLDRQKKR